MFCSFTWSNNEQIRYRKAWSNVAIKNVVITRVVITCVTRVDREVRSACKWRVGCRVQERENARWSRESGGGVPATWRRLDVHWRHHIDHRPTYTSSLSNHRLLLVLHPWIGSTLEIGLIVFSIFRTSLYSDIVWGRASVLLSSEVTASRGG